MANRIVCSGIARRLPSIPPYRRLDWPQYRRIARGASPVFDFQKLARIEAAASNATSRFASTCRSTLPAILTLLIIVRWNVNRSRASTHSILTGGTPVPPSQQWHAA